jgi:hypothetical protein
MWDDYGLVDISCGFLTQKHSSRGHLELVSRTRMLCDFTILGRRVGLPGIDETTQQKWRWKTT